MTGIGGDAFWLIYEAETRRARPQRPRHRLHGCDRDLILSSC
jgi:hypothetical protein